MKKMSIKLRLKIFAIVVSIFIVMGAGYVAYNLVTLEKETTILRENAVQQILLGSKIRLSVVQVQQWLTDISATRGAEGYDDGFSEAEKWAKSFREESERLKTYLADRPDMIKLIDETEQRFDEFYSMGKEMANVYIKEGPAAGNVFMEKFDPFAENLSKNVDKLEASLIGPMEKRFLGIFDFIHSFKQLILSISGFIAIAVLFGFGWLSRSINNGLLHFVSLLEGAFERVSATADLVGDSSRSLGDATSEQAASVQETASSIEEISSMVTRNSESSIEAQKLSEGSQKELLNGKRIIDEMIDVVVDIEKTNHVFADHMKESNQKINEIVDVIGQIAEKTKVINDIVFQTKLLSFNASVEAARAGEHGKGFAVVAEEVGNLAQLSGDSAHEIGEMLDSSIQHVSNIVRETQMKMDQLLKEGADKIKLGTVKANETGEVLEKILKTSGEVNSRVGEISLASKEQSEGVREITSAVGELDTTTQQNMSIAQKNAQFSDDLRQNSVELFNTINGLKGIVGIDEGLGVKKHVNRHGKKYGKRRIEAAPQLNLKVEATKNVLEFSHKEEPVEKVAQKYEEPIVNKAVGDDIGLPGKDDPRFEDL